MGEAKKRKEEIKNLKANGKKGKRNTIDEMIANVKSLFGDRVAVVDCRVSKRGEYYKDYYNDMKDVSMEKVGEWVKDNKKGVTEKEARDYAFWAGGKAADEVSKRHEGKIGFSAYKAIWDEMEDTCYYYIRGMIVKGNESFAA